MSIKKFNVKNAVLAGIIAIFGALSVGCGNGKDAKQAKADHKKEVVEFKFADNPTFDYVYVADALGYFKNSHIRPKYVGKIDEGQIIPAIGSGELDLGRRHTPLVISAIASGADVKIIAAGTQPTKEHPHMKYFVRKDSGINDIKDFSGKKIAINSFGACSEYVTKKLLKDNGLSGKVNFVQIPNDQLDLVLKQGTVDISIIHPPQSGRAEQTPELKKLFDDYDIDHGISGMSPYTINGEFARQHPKEVKELLAILSKTAHWINTHPDEAKKIIAKRLGMQEDLVEIFNYFDDQIVPKKGIQYWIDLLVDEGKLKPGQITPEKVYTNKYNPNVKESK